MSDKRAVVHGKTICAAMGLGVPSNQTKERDVGGSVSISSIYTTLYIIALRVQAIIHNKPLPRLMAAKVCNN